MATLHEMNIGTDRAERPLSEVIAERRATPHFESTPVPNEVLEKILWAGLQAPSGNNLQPWRFLVVRDPEQRKRLRAAAMDQAKVDEAPVVIVACGDTEGWRHGDTEEMLRLGNEHGFSSSGNESQRRSIEKLLGGQGGTSAGISGDVNIWVNRHVMIAYTTMMWMAEVLGYDTAPMEGFWEDKVREVLRIPDSVRVVALLAIGHRKSADKRFGGRFDTSRTVFDNTRGQPLEI